MKTKPFVLAAILIGSLIASLCAAQFAGDGTAGLLPDSTIYNSLKAKKMITFAKMVDQKTGKVVPGVVTVTVTLKNPDGTDDKPTVNNVTVADAVAQRDRIAAEMAKRLASLNAIVKDLQTAAATP